MDVAPAVHRIDGRILGSFSKDWRRDQRNQTVESMTVCDQMHARRVSVKYDSIYGRCEFATLEPGLHLSVFDLNLPATFQSRVVGEDLVEFNFRLSGDMSLSGDWGEINLDRPSTLIWYQPEGHDDVWEALGNPDAPTERSLSLYCERWWVERLLQANAEFAQSLDGMLAENGGMPSYRIIASPADCAESIRGVFCNDYGGARRLLFLKAKGYELLASVLGSLTEEQDFANGRRYFTQRDRKNMAQAKQILELEYASPPTVSRLARRVGVNESKLNLGLKQLYGSTAHQIVRARRLERARELLAQTDLSVSEVGFSVGYAHHSTFTAAFVERYGISPKRYSMSRRQREP